MAVRKVLAVALMLLASAPAVAQKGNALRDSLKAAMQDLAFHPDSVDLLLKKAADAAGEKNETIAKLTAGLGVTENKYAVRSSVGNDAEKGAVAFSAQRAENRCARRSCGVPRHWAASRSPVNCRDFSARRETSIPP